MSDKVISQQIALSKEIYLPKTALLPIPSCRYFVSSTHNAFILFNFFIGEGECIDLISREMSQNELDNININEEFPLSCRLNIKCIGRVDFCRSYSHFLEEDRDIGSIDSLSIFDYSQIITLKRDINADYQETFIIDISSSDGNLPVQRVAGGAT